MQIQCRYCGNYISDTESKCPFCGATNEDLNRTTYDTPRTIEELKAWYVARKLPPYEITRFFIGENRSESRCFGIYLDSKGDYVVYKNKADGTRAVRYAGKDEAYAVNEIYTKLKDEILNQKAYNVNHPKSTNSYTSNGYANYGGRGASPERQRSIVGKFVLIWLFAQIVLPIIVTILGVIFVLFTPTNDNGYFYKNNNLYYNDTNLWYKYDKTTGAWEETKKPKISMYESSFGDTCLGSTWKDSWISEYNLGANARPLTKELWYRQKLTPKGKTSNYAWSPKGESYYIYEDNAYYYLDYGSKQHWYEYNNDNNEWEEISYVDLDDDFYYYTDEYRRNFLSANDGYVSFTESTYYDDYRDYKSTHSVTTSSSSSYDYDDSYSNSYDNSYSNDSSYDWDYDDDWDSGYTDWDSDW